MSPESAGCSLCTPRVITESQRNSRALQTVNSPAHDPFSREASVWTRSRPSISSGWWREDETRRGDLGAGISAESGLKTFRAADGLWRGYRPEEVACPQAWRRNPGLVLDFYNERRKAVREARPNAAHRALVELERAYDVRIVTQNVDDLHERAGSSSVLHLHGACGACAGE